MSGSVEAKPPGSPFGQKIAAFELATTNQTGIKGIQTCLVEGLGLAQGARKPW